MRTTRQECASASRTAREGCREMERSHRQHDDGTSLTTEMAIRCFPPGSESRTRTPRCSVTGSQPGSRRSMCDFLLARPVNDC